MKKKILITGGAGFIGSHLVRLMVTKYPDYQFFNLDALTYAGNLENLKDIEKFPNYHFVKANILDAALLKVLFHKYSITDVIHLAAESHVDRSIISPLDFVYTNVIGTVNLLNTAKDFWKGDLSYENAQDGTWDKRRDHLFYHVSTDEVYGSLGKNGLFKETTPYDPNSPYSASKASSDHFVRAYRETYHLPIIVSNCSNNYGPNHFPEKLIPLFIDNIINEKELPVYGDGLYTRDWLYVIDHARAIDLIFHEGKIGDTYNIGGFNEWTNIDLVKLLCLQMDKKLGRAKGESEGLIKYVKDRPGHDRRYAIDATKLEKELGWTPSVTFEQGLEATIDWFLKNKSWLDNISNNSYQSYFERNFRNVGEI
ncbi:dTDP-glucose 4,6-dehydratase [Aquirufa antheringensis]|uniref:dTDP-glucose 4,6-dehydratase n=1 Tax=Aquirufa antheringensis TaxID=2516559 RepID=UPI0022A8BAE1|nr:dTDP-glucose 4,6-dehydratase [Aquirufa antheringensis]MCZ2486957.1 dTDP-glucose 4,6-dehydratase [Aquirufa antheringensis]